MVFWNSILFNQCVRFFSAPRWLPVRMGGCPHASQVRLSSDMLEGKGKPKTLRRVEMGEEVLGTYVI